MRKQKDTSTSLSASSSLCSEQVLQKLSTLEELLKKKDDKPLTFKRHVLTSVMRQVTFTN